MLHFWLSCLIKSFIDTVSFIGTNNTGLLFTVLVAGATIWRAIYPQFKQHGWAGVRSNWWKLIGEGVLIGVGAFLLVWAGHLIAAPYGLYTEVQAQGHKSEQQSEHRIRHLVSTCATEKSSLFQEINNWRIAATEAKTEAALKEGIDETLQKQNRDQQSSINGCLSQAMKLLAPAPFKMTALKLDVPGAIEPQNAAIKTADILLLANQSVTPIRLVTVCTGPIVNFSSSVVGSGIRSGNDYRLSYNTYQTSISLPAWTPDSPLLVSVQYRGGADFNCNFKKQ